MRFEPLKATKPKPVALVLPAHRRMTILTADGRKDVSGRRGVEQALRKLSAMQCYVPAVLTSLKYVSPATSWTCHQWRGRPTRMVHEPSGTTFTSLRGALASARDPEAMWTDLMTTLQWVNGYGIRPGTISTMAAGLFRASLSAPVAIGFDPAVARHAFYGGRQEARVQTDYLGRPKVYQHMAAVDLKSAYGHAMGTAPYGLSLRSVSPSTDLDPAVPGLARASVDVPVDMPYGPLPVRIAPSIISFQTGPVQGTWPWVELAAAKELGCEVVVKEAWAPRVTLDLFGPWWSMVQGADRLPTEGSRQLAKALRNSLWGQFAMNGEDSSYTRWADERGEEPFTVDQDPRGMPHAWTTHIAAETTARVRTRLLVEGIYAGPGFPVHTDTDGYVVRGSRPLPVSNGQGAGHWRTKAAMRRIDIRGPQLYRWTCGKECGLAHPQWHYVAAGVPADGAKRVFEQEGNPVTAIAHRGLFDICLPGTHSADHRLIADLLAQTKVVAGV